MPLNLTEFNHFYIISKICGQEKHRHYLEALGFVPGSEVTILSELHGYYIVMVREAKSAWTKHWPKKSLSMPIKADKMFLCHRKMQEHF